MLVDRRTLILGAATATWATAATATTAPTPDGAASVPAQMPDLPAERVLGIGGLFFRSRDPKALARWYQHHLGIDPVPMAAGQSAWQQAAGPTAFAPFPMKTDYFEAQQGWMLNFRVRSMDAMAAQLQAAGIEVKVDPATYPNGRFARLHDPEGNPIELWEPASHA